MAKTNSFTKLVSSIEFHPLSNQSKALARCVLVLADILKVTVFIKTGEYGLFAGFPQHKQTYNGEEKWMSDVYFADEEGRKLFNEFMVQAYQDWKNGSEKSDPAPKQEVKKQTFNKIVKEKDDTSDDDDVPF